MASPQPSPPSTLSPDERDRANALTLILAHVQLLQRRLDVDPNPELEWRLAAIERQVWKITALNRNRLTSSPSET